MMELPLVSVIIPTYNYRQYIGEAIESVIQQTYPATQIEIIVIDDGSSDGTRETLQPLVASGTIQYHYQKNKGKARATREGIIRSDGKYLFTLDADDYFLPQKIERTVAIFEAYPGVVHVASPAQFVNGHKEVTYIEEFPEDILEKSLDGSWLLTRFYENHILFGGGSTYAARTSALKKIVMPDEVDMYTDEFLIMAILLHGDSFFLREPLSVWRAHGINYSGAADTKEKKIQKGERLLRSSAGMLQYIEGHSFSNKIKQIYRLIHITRVISYKETIESKQITDIIVYSKQVFLNLRPSWKLIKKYHVLNRLVPTFLYRLTKRSLKR